MGLISSKNTFGKLGSSSSKMSGLYDHASSLSRIGKNTFNTKELADDDYSEDNYTSNADYTTLQEK